MPIAPTKCSWKRGSVAVSIFSTRRTTSSISVASGAVEQGDPRAGAGGVARARHLLGFAVGDEPEHHRVDRVDVRAERAGQADPVDVVDPVVVHQQTAARVQRALGQLDLAHVVLREHEPGLGLVHDVRARAAVVDHARGAILRAGVDHAVGGEDAREVELGDQLDDARAADACRGGRAGLVGPHVAADGAEPELEGGGVDADALDRAGRGPLAARDLRTLERGSRRAGGGEQSIAVPEHDLGVGPDVDQQVDDILVVRRLAQDHARGVGADVAGDQRQRVHARARVGADTQVASRHGERTVGDRRERRATELGRVEPEDEVVHDRIADHDELEHVVARGVCLRAEVAHQLVEAPADRRGQLHLAARMHHHVAHPAHQVLAEPDLRVHRAGAREHVARVQVAQVSGHRRRAHVERHPERHVVEPREHRRDQRAVAHRHRRGPCAGPKRLLQPGQHDRIDVEPREVPIALEGGEQTLEIAAGRRERRLLHLDVVQPHDRVDVDRVGVGLLAHDLAVDLRLRGHVDHQVAADLRVASEPAVGRQAVALAVPLLGLGERDQVVGRARQPVLRERPLHRHHLAAAADPTAPTHRVEVDAERAGGVQHARAVGHLAPPARRREDDRVRGRAHPSLCGPTRAARPPRRRPVPSAPARGRAVRVPPDPCLRVRVGAHQHVGGHRRLFHLFVQRRGDRARHPARDRHRQERAVDPVAVGQPERHVRGAARCVHAQLVVQPAHQPEHLLTGRPHRTDRHHERVDDDVVRGDAVVGGRVHDLLGDPEPHVGILADPGLVVRDRDDRGAVLGDQREHRFDPFVLAGHRVDERLALVRGEPGFERGDDRGVDRQRQVGERLHELDRRGEDPRLVGERDPRVHVEHVRAGAHLRVDVGDHGREVPGGHLGRELLPAGGVDPLPDDRERPPGADHVLAGRGGNDSVGQR